MEHYSLVVAGAGSTPPYFSKDGGETWQPADRGVHPPASSYCLGEYRGRVYIGTGYEPEHGQIYRWLGDSGPNHWELVQDIAPPRSMVWSFAVFNDRLFVGSWIYGWMVKDTKHPHRFTFIPQLSHGVGGGACCETGAVISDCMITGNSADFGGGVYGGTLYNCLLTSNSAYASGGGAYNSALYNCTLTQNSAASGGGTFQSTLYNSIVYRNISSMDISSNYASSTLRYCCTMPPPGSETNITADPQFMNAAAGDYRLTCSSPCINSGTNQDWMIDASDLAGNPRIISGRVDMGAYEFSAQTTPVIDSIMPANGYRTTNATIQMQILAYSLAGMANRHREWRCGTSFRL